MKLHIWPILLLSAFFFIACDKDTPLKRITAKLEIEPSTIDFETVAVGDEARKEIRVKNIGVNPIKITGAKAFSPDSKEIKDFIVSIGDSAQMIDPGAHIKFQVVFAPKSEGKFSGEVSLFENSIKLSPALKVLGKALKPNIKISSDTVDFGETTVTQTKKVSVIFENVADVKTPFSVHTFSGQDRSLFGISDENEIVTEFSDHIAPKQKYELFFTFTPNELGEKKAQVQIQFCVDCKDSSALSLIGKGVKPIIFVEPAELEFENVLPKETKILSFTITNAGISSLDIQSIEKQEQTSDEFAITLPDNILLPYSMKPSEKLTVNVSYTPTDSLIDDGAIFVLSNAFESQEISIQLTGNPIGPDLRIVPPRVHFGIIEKGSTAEQVVLLRNEGNKTITILDVLYDFDSSPNFSFMPAPFPSIELAAGGDTALVKLRYEPKEDGKDIGKLLIQTDDTLFPTIEVPIEGEAGIAQGCSLILEPSNLQFGLSQKDKESFRTLKIRNHGTEFCEVSNFVIVRGSAEFFVKTDLSSSKKIKPADSFLVDLAFKPTDIGNYEGELQFTSNDSYRTSPFSVPLMGTGDEGCLRAIPDAVDFGTVLTGCGISEKKVQVYNYCSGEAVVNKVEQNSGSSEYITLSGNIGMPYKVSNEPMILAFTFAPPEESDETASYSIYHSLNSQPIILNLKGKSRSSAIVTDSFEQLAQTQLDMLFVIDNSCSMEDEQEKLKTNIHSFISTLVTLDIDFQLAVTTTDVELEAGKFVGTPKIINTTSITQAVSDFAKNATLGINGSGYEQGLEAAYLALSAPLINNENKGFLRPDANLGVVFVTDEEDSSPQPVTFYSNFFQSIKGWQNASKVSASAMLFHTNQIPGYPACTRSFGGVETFGSRYEAVVNNLNGIIYPLCTDWYNALSSFAQTAAGYHTRFFLSSQPDPSTIVIEVNNIAVGSQYYEYDPNSNSINFKPMAVPPFGAVILVTYNVGC